MLKETDDSSTVNFSSDDESSDEESVKSKKRTRKEKSLSKQYVFMAKNLAYQKNVEQKDIFEGLLVMMNLLLKEKLIMKRSWL